jgi:hypothetical protein
MLVESIISIVKINENLPSMGLCYLSFDSITYESLIIPTIFLKNLCKIIDFILANAKE